MKFVISTFSNFFQSENLRTPILAPMLLVLFSLGMLGCVVPNPALNHGACGDGVKYENDLEDFYEQCDDGNTLDGDGCSSTCLFETCADGIQNQGETNIDCGGQNCQPCSPVCGNGFHEVNEECDDSNTSSGDGCSSNCLFETCADGIQNQGETDIDCGGENCQPCDPVCGNGVVDGWGEQCDDGNSNNEDDCLNNCLEATCGDGVVQAGIEECDDGNNIETDNCTSDCLNPTGSGTP